MEIRKNSVWEGSRFIEKRIKAILGQKSLDTVFGLQAAAVSYVYQVLQNQCKKKNFQQKRKLVVASAHKYKILYSFLFYYILFYSHAYYHAYSTVSVALFSEFAWFVLQ